MPGGRGSAAVHLRGEGGLVQGGEPEHIRRPEPHPPGAAAHPDPAQEVPGGRPAHHAVSQQPEAQVRAAGEPLRGAGRAGGLGGALGGGAAQVHVGREGCARIRQRSMNRNRCPPKTFSLSLSLSLKLHHRRSAHAQRR